MNADHMRQVLRDAVANAGGQAKWARENGFSRSAVSHVLAGRKAAMPGIARALGYERRLVVDYVLTAPNNDGIDQRMEIERSREDDGDE